MDEQTHWTDLNDYKPCPVCRDGYHILVDDEEPTRFLCKCGHEWQEDGNAEETGR